MKRCLAFVLAAFLSLASLAFAQPTGVAAPPPPAALPLSLTDAEKLFDGPTLVTLHLKEASAALVLEELSKQSGVPLRLLFSDEANPAPKYTIDIEKQPFWTAFLEVCKQLQVAPQLAGDRIFQDLMPGNPDDSLGALLPLHPMVNMTAREIRHEHTFSLRGANGAFQTPQDRHSIYFNGWVLTDPKFRVAPNTTIYVEITAAVDEKGQTLQHEQGGASFVQSPVLWDLQINLDGRGDAGKKLASLKGVIKAAIITKSERLEVPDLANAGPVSKIIKTPQGNETYHLIDLAQNGNQIEVTFGVTRPTQAAPLPDEDINVQQLRNARQDLSSFTRLLDAQGRDIPYVSSKVNGEATTLIFARQTEGANATSAPKRLVLDIPVEFRELQIPFEYKDLPLP